MILEKQTRVYRPRDFQAASAGILGTTQRFAIPNGNPIEAIWICMEITNGSTGLLPDDGTQGVQGADNILGMVQRVQLDCVSPVWGAYKAVDFSGIGLLEYAANAGLNLPVSVWDYIRLWQANAATSLGNNAKAKLWIPIMMPHFFAAEPLRTRMLLPCHTWGNQQPVLTVQFQSSANMAKSGNTGTIASALCSIYVVYREMSEAQTSDIESKGGFIKTDIIEQQFSPGVGVGGAPVLRAPLQGPGSYLGLVCRHYLGGAQTTRKEVSNVVTFGSEDIWTLEMNTQTKRQFRWSDLKMENELSTPRNVLSQTSSPFFGPAITAGELFQNPASVYMDFLSDGLEMANELGSVLDANIAFNRGYKWEICGPWANPATNASFLYYGGHRVWGDISSLQSTLAKK